MIEATGLTKFFGPVAAIQDVSFTVEKGEIVGFLGPNAAGKTTTMRILTGVIQPTDGRATVAGYDIVTHSLQARRRIGYLPETIPLYSDMRVASYLHFVAEVKGLRGADRTRRVSDTMERCRITDVSRALIGALSRGYRQRVGIAQALLGNPEVIILDEPTVGLDPKQIIEIRGLIKELGRERTVLLSTHILPEVSMVCERVIIINEGRIVASDTPANLTSRLQTSTRVLVQVEAPPDLVRTEIGRIPGILSVEPTGPTRNHVSAFLVESEKGRDLRQQIARRIVEKGWGLLEIRPAGMTLEDVFIKLVTEEKGGEA